MIYRMQLADSVDEMTFDLLEVPIEDKDIEGTADNTTIDGNVFTDYLWLKKQFVQKWSLMCEDDYTQLRGFYTRQWENAEVPTYKLFVGENRSETLTASGSAFQIQNGTQYDAPLTLTELTGNATQTTYSGKNLMSLEPYRFGYYYGASVGTQVEYDITSAASQVSFTPRADGTSTMVVSASWRGTWFMSQALTAGTYYLNLNGATTTGNLGASVYAMDSDHKIKRQILNTTATPITNQLQMAITLAEGETYISVGIGVRTTSGTNTLGTLMLSAGSTATAYEPYVGGTASPNPDYPQAVNTTTGENVVKIIGKNLSPISQYLGIVWGQGEDDYKNLLNTLGAGTYTFSAVFTITERQDTTDDSKYGIYFANSAGLNVLERPQWGAVGVGATATLTKTFTITETQVGKFTNAYFYGCSGATGNPQSGKADITNIQLELGSTATAYEPYQGQEFEVNLGSIELCKIGTYQDRIYKDDGKWYIEKQIGKETLNGSEDDWSFQSSNAPFRYRLTGAYATYYDASTYISDYFQSVSWDATWTDYEYLVSLNSRNSILAFRYTGISTLDEFKTWLTTHPTTVYYAIATPTTTEITDSTLLAQLNFIANLYGGTNNIMLVGTGAQGEIGVEYTLTYEQEQVIIPETPVRLTLTDGGVINPCGCRQNVQLTMRETVQ